jgi:hypothetical protein
MGRSVAFESGAVLTAIVDWVFQECTDLEIVDLPASLVSVHGAAFAMAAITKVSVDAGSPHMRVIGDFLVDIARAMLIRYFGSSPAIVLSRAVAILGNYCFAYCADLTSLALERGSGLTRVERGAFVFCTSLASILIPASTTMIAGSAFALSGIRHVTVEEGNTHFCVSGQNLLDSTRTALIAFFGTAATVRIDRKIQILCDCCFVDRTTLSRVEFEPGSELRRIEWCAFGGCLSLHSIRIPASIEALEEGWFRSSCFDAGSTFDTVRFESAESLSKMIVTGCADLSGDFYLEVFNLNGEPEIPGYVVERIVSDNFVRLKKSPELSSE